MQRKLSFTFLLLSLLTFAHGSHDFHSCLIKSIEVGNKAIGAPYLEDISIRQLTAQHEPYLITSCFSPNGMQGIRIQSGVYDSTKKVFKDLLTLNSHGNPDAS